MEIRGAHYDPGAQRLVPKTGKAPKDVAKVAQKAKTIEIPTLSLKKMAQDAPKKPTGQMKGRGKEIDVQAKAAEDLIIDKDQKAYREFFDEIKKAQTKLKKRG